MAFKLSDSGNAALTNFVNLSVIAGGPSVEDAVARLTPALDDGGNAVGLEVTFNVGECSGPAGQFPQVLRFTGDDVVELQDTPPAAPAQPAAPDEAEPDPAAPAQPAAPDEAEPDPAAPAAPETPAA